MSSRKNISKRKNIPLNVVKSTTKRIRISHVKAVPISLQEPISVLEQFVEEPCDSSNQHLTEPLIDNNYEMEDDELGVHQPSSHTKRKQKAAERWEVIQNAAIDVAIATMGEPHCACVSCKEGLGSVKCHHCGPRIHYCEACAVRIHQYSLFHHYMEVWQVYMTRFTKRGLLRASNSLTMLGTERYDYNLKFFSIY